MQLRLQVILSRAGVASRRTAEEMIQQGKVSVNGQVVTELGSRADPEKDTITVSGKKVEVPRQNLYLLVNKPEGTITTKDDPEGRPTVMALLPKELQTLHPVGRLDWDTEGALLFTNDGPLTHALTHPRFEVERVYHIKLQGKLGEEDAVRWLEGTTLDDGRARAESADVLGSTGKHTWFQISLREGRNREVRRLAEALGYEVLRLRRYSFAGLNIDDLPPGGYRFLDLDEIEHLREISKEAGAEIEERPVASPPEGVSRTGQMVQTRGHRGALAFDVTPKGLSPKTQSGTTEVVGFDEDGYPLPRPITPKAPEKPIGRHGTRTWISEDAQKARPAKPAPVSRGEHDTVEARAPRIKARPQAEQGEQPRRPFPPRSDWNDGPARRGEGRGERRPFPPRRGAPDRGQPTEERGQRADDRPRRDWRDAPAPMRQRRPYPPREDRPRTWQERFPRTEDREGRPEGRGQDRDDRRAPPRREWRDGPDTRGPRSDREYRGGRPGGSADNRGPRNSDQGFRERRETSERGEQRADRPNRGAPRQEERPPRRNGPGSFSARSEQRGPRSDRNNQPPSDRNSQPPRGRSPRPKHRGKR